MNKLFAGMLLTFKCNRPLLFNNYSMTQIFPNRPSSTMTIPSPLPPPLNISYLEYEERNNKSLEVKPHNNRGYMSKRTGILGYKQGMTNYWDKWGTNIPCSVIKVDLCQVVQLKKYSAGAEGKAREDRNKNHMIQLGVGVKNLHNINKPQIGILYIYIYI